MSEEDAEDAEDHRVPIAGGWALWRWVCLRGAGFAASELLELSIPEAARAADRQIDREASREAARARAREACERALLLADGKARKPIVRALKQLAAGAIPEDFGGDEQKAALHALRLASAGVDAASAELSAQWRPANLRAGAALRAAARSPRFREALVWQNRRALRTGVDSLLRQSDGATDFKTRQNEALVASYLQRYAAKNDSIGFFGPVGWGRFGAGAAVSLAPGRGLLATRQVYFEHWGIDALAGRLAEDPALRPHLAPRRMPTVRVDGTTLFYPIGRRTELPAALARLLGACDGETSARAIAEELCGEPELELSGHEEVYELLSALAGKHLLVWTLELPPGDPHPERTLRRLIERVDEPALRAEALSALDEMERGRSGIAAAAGDAAALDEAMGALEASFARLTATEGVRRAGQAYAGRTLVYEDCRRDVELSLGPELLDRLGPPLSLILQSARWYTHAVAQRYRDIVRRAYRELLPQATGTAVGYLELFRRIEPHLASHQAEGTATVREVVDELRARWARLLRVAPGERRVERRAAELERAVGDVFAAPHPGWPGARFHSPDVLLAARGLDAIRRGEYLLVLGEVHAGWNTFSVPVFIDQHPRPEALFRALEVDLPRVRVAQVEPKEQATRVYQALVSRHDLELEVGSTRSRRPRAQVLEAGSLVVEETEEGQLVVRDLEGRHRFDIIAFLEGYLLLDSMAHFGLVSPAPHTPRITIDHLVVARETWRCAAGELGFALAEDPIQRFVGARRFAMSRGLPRFVFVKVPEEPKPCYVDLESSVYVESFAKLVRKASAVSISEMLPSLDETWLVDAEGRAYTSELRMVAVDPEPWRPG
ncbi:lantibiotic dehydratase [Sorangium sp. So ce887]|uniref:lantibiotic dehydratase n=1 Tax=Sorangium sp. So ce887 TaxID=3133324 RepID=UPI003F602E13